MPDDIIGVALTHIDNHADFSNTYKMLESSIESSRNNGIMKMVIFNRFGETLSKFLKISALSGVPLEINATLYVNLLTLSFPVEFKNRYNTLKEKLKETRQCEEISVPFIRDGFRHIFECSGSTLPESLISKVSFLYTNLQMKSISNHELFSLLYLYDNHKLMFDTIVKSNYLLKNLKHFDYYLFYTLYSDSYLDSDPIILRPIIVNCNKAITPKLIDFQFISGMNIIKYILIKMIDFAVNIDVISIFDIIEESKIDDRCDHRFDIEGYAKTKELIGLIKETNIKLYEEIKYAYRDVISSIQ